MTSQATAEPSLGERLLAKGWGQCKLFRAPFASTAFNAWATDTDTNLSLVVLRKLLKENDILIVVTQDCDIAASAEQEPFVEALVCRVEKREKYIQAIDRNSARAFLVDPDAKLVAIAPYRVLFAKEVLLDLTPQRKVS